MFKLDQSNFYSWPVKVDIPTDSGKFESASFDGHFKRISQTRVEEIIDLAAKKELSDVGLASEVLIGWKGVQDGGEETPYSESAKEKLLDIPSVAKSVVLAFFESLNGAKRKN